jgi:hypothetical protein
MLGTTDQTVATLMAWAPNYGRAIRDITVGDLAGPYQTIDGVASPYDPGADRVWIPAETVLEMRAGSWDFGITWEGADYHVATYKVRAAGEREIDSPRSDVIFVLLGGEEYLDRLYERETWTCPDGLVVHISRERGVWADWDTRRR